MKSAHRLFVPVLALIVAVWAALPLLWMLITAFKPESAIRTSTLTVGFVPTLDNFRNLFLGGNRAGSYLVNSLLVTGISTLIAVTLGCMAGYGLAHWASRYQRDVAFWVLSTRMAPIAAVIVPLFVMFRGAGLINTIPGLVLAHLSFNLPFAIWLMSAFFTRIPESVEEAALLDGCTKWRRFLTVSLPMPAPASSPPPCCAWCSAGTTTRSRPRSADRTRPPCRRPPAPWSPRAASTGACSPPSPSWWPRPCSSPASRCGVIW